MCVRARMLAGAAFAVAFAGVVGDVRSAGVLTLPLVFERVKQRAPEVLAAETQIREERASRAGATPLFADNPSLEGGAGMVAAPSDVGGWRATRVGPSAWLQVAVPVEIALQRWSRVAAVDARVAARQVAKEEVTREALFAAGAAFQRAVYADRDAGLLADAVRVAERALQNAEAFKRAGAASQLDVRLVRLELREAQRALTGAAASRQELIGQVATLLGLSGSALSAVEGRLARDVEPPLLQDLLERADARPDVRLRLAERQAALREANVAAGSAFPTPILKTAYQYWNTEHSLMAFVEVPLPVFSRGQGEQARAHARARGLAAEADARVDAARAEIRAAHALLTSILAARRSAEQVDESESPASLLADVEAHYAERKVDLVTLLNVQRRITQGKRIALELELKEALAWLWLDAATGVLQ